MIKIIIASFGYKYGMIENANFLFDVRCFKNPYYIPELKHKNGMDEDVYNYIFSDLKAQSFSELIQKQLSLAIELYENKNCNEPLVIAFGCTGGQHRSVAFAKRTYEYFCALKKDVHLLNRDLEKVK